MRQLTGIKESAHHGDVSHTGRALIQSRILPMSGLNPVSTASSVIRSGRLISMPSEANNSSCSDSLISGRRLLNLSSRYFIPLVLKKRLSFNYSFIQLFRSSTLGVSSVMLRDIKSTLFSSSHFAFYSAASLITINDRFHINPIPLLDLSMSPSTKSSRLSSVWVVDSASAFYSALRGRQPPAWRSSRRSPPIRNIKWSHRSAAWLWPLVPSETGWRKSPSPSADNMTFRGEEQSVFDLAVRPIPKIPADKPFISPDVVRWSESVSFSAVIGWDHCEITKVIGLDYDVSISIW